MKNFKFGKILVLALIAFMLGACSKGSAIEVGEKAPDFSLKDLDGKTISFSDFKGKVIILDFFASWCPPCRQEIPDFIELQKSYGQKGFSVVGVSQTDIDYTKNFADKMGINYPLLIGDEKTGALYGPIRFLPTTFVIDKDSKVRKIYVGYKPKEAFESDIKELLK